VKKKKIKKMEKSREIVDEQGVHLLKHSDGSDCIGCSPPPRLKKQWAVVGQDAVHLVASSEDSSASQSQESPDASDSFQPSIPEDEEEAMEDSPKDEMSFYSKLMAEKFKDDGKSYLN